MTDTKVENTKKTRRRFLTGAAGVAAGGAAAVAMPNVSRAQTKTLKMQGSWGSASPFSEFARDYARRVNEMSGGSLKIDYLPVNAIVAYNRVQDAAHKGILDAAHTVTVYWYGKSKVASLFGSGPVFGQTAHHTLAWIYYGGGQELYDELMAKLGLNVVGFFGMPMPTQPLGWFQKEIKSSADMVGLKYRTVGLAADLMQEMGVKVTQLGGSEIVPALEKGVIEAFEFNNPTADMQFGAQDVSKHYMMGSYHQASEYFEFIFNKDMYNGLPKEHQAILKYAVEAASSDNFWKAMDWYSRDLQKLINEDGVNVHRTPESIMKDQLNAWDVMIKKLEDEDPFFKKVVKSQKDFSHRVAFYELLNAADYKLAYEHNFPGELGF